MPHRRWLFSRPPCLDRIHCAVRPTPLAAGRRLRRKLLRDGATLALAFGLALGGAARAAESKGPAARAPGLRAGAATSNITPLLDVVLDGTIMQIGPAKHVHDELHARCLVLDDGTTRLAFVVCDTTMIATEVIDRAKESIRQRTGLAPAHVTISATHSHATPRALDLGLGPANQAYNDFFVARIADGVRRAVNNLAPAQIGWGRGRKPEFVENRRWFVRPEAIPPNPFGENTDQVQMGAPPPLRVKPAGPVDPELFVLSLRRADGRPLAVLANFGLHYVGGLPGGRVSADYYGVFADEVQRLLGADRQNPPFVAMMANGTSGDVMSGSARATDAPPSPGREWPYARMQEVGEGLAREVQRVCQKIEYKTDVRLAVIQSQLALGVRKPDAARLAWAEKTLGQKKSGARLSRPQIYAREAQLLAGYPDTQSIPIQAFRIGDLGIATIPCEVFAETGLAIKQESPFPATFTIELANGYYGYLPTPAQHALGGYETWPARSSHLEVQAEPRIRAEVSRLLRELERAGP